MKRKVGIGCSAIVAGIAILVTFIMWATSGVTGTVDEFIEHLAQERPDEAYQMLGTQVTKELSREAFDDFLVGTRLRKAKSGFWTQRSVENGVGNVSGTITLKDGGEVSGRFYLEKTGDKWLIEGIHFDEAPSNPEDSESMTEFVNSFVKELSSPEVHEAYSMFGDQITKDLDLKGFSELLSATGLNKAEKAEWASSETASMGGVVKGTITTKDGTLVDVKLNLEKVANGWRIQGFNYKVKGDDSEAPPPPNPKDILQWSRSFLSALAVYMDKSDPKPMAALCRSKLAAKIIEQDGLAGVVASFPDRPGLRKILDTPIVLTQEPKLDGNTLHIEARSEVQEKGHYLRFQLDYSPEKGQWKIGNLNLQTRSTKDDKPAEAWKP